MRLRQTRLPSVSFTAEDNAIDYLRQACFFAKQALHRPARWKWVVIALHGAVYGFAVCASYGTNYESVIQAAPKRRKKLMAGQFHGRSPLAGARLVSFDDALRQSGVVLKESEADSIRRLAKVFRNHFEHFVPVSWMILVDGMPRITADGLEVVRRLSTIGQTSRRLGASSMRSIDLLVSRTKNRLLDSRLHRDWGSGRAAGGRDT
jgi:hypothetical protein